MLKIGMKIEHLIVVTNEKLNENLNVRYELYFQ
jgi:hypothetical protein